MNGPPGIDLPALKNHLSVTETPILMRGLTDTTHVTAEGPQLKLNCIGNTRERFPALRHRLKLDYEKALVKITFRPANEPLF